MKQFKLQKTLLSTAIVSAIFGLSACGGGGSSDSGTSGQNNVQLSGAVVDDYLAFSRIYVDVNGNNKYDSEFEPSAFTDKDGYFSTAKDGTNYCATPGSYNYRYCFESEASVKNGGVIRIEKGRDLLTTQTYERTMSLLMDGTTSGLRVSALSSLSSQITNLSDADYTAMGTTKEAFQQSFNNFLSTYLGTTTKAAGDKPDPNTVDLFDPAVQNSERAFKLMVQMHKIKDILVKLISDAKAPTGLSSDQKRTIDNDIYKSFLKFAINNANNADPFSASSVIDSILADLATTYSFSYNSTNAKNANGFLNCVLAVSGDNYTNQAAGCSVTQGTTLAGKKQSLTAAEVIREIVEQNQTANLDNAIKIAAASGYDYTKRDFSLLAKAAVNTASASFNATNAGVSDDFPKFEGTDVTLEEDGNSDAFRMFFQANEDVAICQREKTNSGLKYNLIKGKYYQDLSDTGRKSIAYMNVLGTTYTITNLDPTSVLASSPSPSDDIYECTTNGTSAKQSCIGVSYRSTEDNTDKENYFGNSTKTTQQLFVSTDVSVPTSDDACKQVF